jgi:LPS-assembly protein
VKRASGFLLPTFFSNSRTGVGVNIPYYWALAPNYDFTLNVAPMTRQIGPLVSGEWRHRLVNGSYSIRASGIFQQDKEAFQDPADTGRTSRRRATGTSAARSKPKASSRSTAAGIGAGTPRFSPTGFLRRTIRPRPNRAARRRLQQIYLTGQGERSYFDARAMYFTGFSRLDNQSQLPVIHPVIDHSYVLDQPVLGGELSFQSNFTSLTRREADFDPTLRHPASELHLIALHHINPGDASCAACPATTRASRPR